MRRTLIRALRPAAVTLALAAPAAARADVITLDNGAIIHGDLGMYQLGGDCHITVTEGPLLGSAVTVPCRRVARFERAADGPANVAVPIVEAPAVARTPAVAVAATPPAPVVAPVAVVAAPVAPPVAAAPPAPAVALPARPPVPAIPDIPVSAPPGTVAPDQTPTDAPAASAPAYGAPAPAPDGAPLAAAEGATPADPRSAGRTRATLTG